MRGTKKEESEPEAYFRMLEITMLKVSPANQNETEIYFRFLEVRSVDILLSRGTC